VALPCIVISLPEAYKASNEENFTDIVKLVLRGCDLFGQYQKWGASLNIPSLLSKNAQALAMRLRYCEYQQR